jgi:hypothetical protein
MSRLTRQIFLGTLAAILAAGGIFVAVSIILRGPPSDEETSYELGTPEPKNTAVDVIDGYKSIKLGMTGEELQGRLKTASWAVPQPIPPLDHGFYEIRDMLPEETEWAGMHISKIELTFDKGLLVEVELHPAEDLTDFKAAFQQKFGSPTSTNASFTEWEGNDTQLTFFEFGVPVIKINRQSVDSRVAALKSEEQKQGAEEQARRVEVMKKKLDGEKH